MRHPISGPANEVLHWLVTECACTAGYWDHEMSPGCAEIWGTQLGYRAGLRRGRDDLIELGEVTAERQSAAIRQEIWAMIFGGASPDRDVVSGFPALFISGTLGGRGTDGLIFSRGIDDLEKALGSEGPLRENEASGAAVMLAELARLQSGDEAARNLARARSFAERLPRQHRPHFAAFAWCAIARSSGDEGDRARALEAVDGLPYRFDPVKGGLAPTESPDDILSLHLCAVYALADLSEITRDPRHHRLATALLEYLFTDAYLSEHRLKHHRSDGVLADTVCSGCNLMALMLVDRLYGETWKIDSLPALPEREDVPPLRRPKPDLPWGDPEHPDLEITVSPLPPEMGPAYASIDLEAGVHSIRLRHDSLDAWVYFYMTVPGRGLDGEMIVQQHHVVDGTDWNYTTRKTIALAESDAATLEDLGPPPLKVRVTFTRKAPTITKVAFETVAEGTR